MAGDSTFIQPLGELLDTRQRWLLLGSLMLAMFVGALDQTVVATATPSILADLGGFDLFSWMFTSYMLASTVVIPLVGKLSDIYGRKFFVIAGIVVFMLASAACGAATTMPSLIMFRAVQGLGGGMIFASVFACIGDIFPPAERSKYTGLFTGTFSLASILGPTVGGFFTDSIDWRWVFYINVPFSLMAIPAIWMNLPTRRGTRRPKIDFLGAALLSSASVLTLLGLVWAGDKYDWGSSQIIAIFGTAAVFVAAFIWQELRHPEPMLPLYLFRNPVFVLANLIVFALGAGMFGVLTYLPTFVQTALGASATASGVITTPQSIGLLVASVVGGQLIARTGHYKWMTTIGGVIVICGLIPLARLDVGTPELGISATMVVLGVGFGLMMPTMSLVVQNTVEYRHLGVASSSSQFFRQIGTVLGTAIFGTILATTYHGAFHDQLSATDQSTIGASVVHEFDDPTIALNPQSFAAVQSEIRAASPTDGQALVDRALAAQREAIAIAIRRLFAAAVGVAVVTLVLTLFMREQPLRRDFKPAIEVEGVPIEPEEEPEPGLSLEPAPAPSGGR